VANSDSQNPRRATPGNGRATDSAPLQGDSLAVARGVRCDVVQDRLSATLRALPSAVSARLSAVRASERETRRASLSLRDAPLPTADSDSTIEAFVSPAPLSAPLPARRSGTWERPSAPASRPFRSGEAQNPSRPFRGFTGPGAPAALRASEAPAPKRNKRNRTRRNRPGKRQRANGAITPK